MVPFLEDVHAALNVLLASFVGALLTRFWTREKVRRSVRALQEGWRSWGLGCLMLLVGIVLQMPGIYWLPLRPHPVLSVISVSSYPFWLGGVFLMYRGAHPGERDEPAADEETAEVVP